MIYVHEATARLLEGEHAALGAAITIGLCGHWDHDGQCRWPHYTDVAEAEPHIVTRTIFVADPTDEGEIRARLDKQLRTGGLEVPEGTCSRWELLAVGPVEPTAEELDHGRRIRG
ncbi:MAG: hypothetical protein H0U36_01685 [Nocardioidaceae bacterium]|nr:hypothetical protein [Nocardioidaceae bacterium]